MPASEPAAEALSWTQARDKPEWVVRSLAVVDVGLRRRVMRARMVAPVPSWGRQPAGRGDQAREDLGKADIGRVWRTLRALAELAQTDR